jgi:hypothetical protein
MGFRAASLCRRRQILAVVTIALAALGTVSGLSAADPGHGPAPALINSPPLGNGADPNTNGLSLGDMWSPWNPAPGQLGTWAVGFATDQVLGEAYCNSRPTALRRMPCAGTTAKRILSTWSRHYDDATAPQDAGAGVSEQNGLAFTNDLNDAMFDGFDLTTSTRLRDGRILTAQFTANVTSPTGLAVRMGASSDVGRTWTDWTATVMQPSTPLGWIRVQRTLIELNDGTLLMTGYGALKATGEGVSLVFESTDDAHTWTVRSLVRGPRGINEMSMSRTSDGRLVGLFRENGSPSGLLQLYPLLQAFSDDDGKTWTKPTELQAPNGLPSSGADPNVILLPNGTLMASYGRPDNTVLVSWDGTGRTWDKGDTVFGNPVMTTDPGRYHGSSGNTTIQPVGTNYALFWGDTCHTVYLCREYGQETKVFIRRIDALKGGAGKVDLMTKYLDGSVHLYGQVLPAKANAPEARLDGAIDGSTGVNAAAFLKPGTDFTIQLDRPRDIDQIGLMLGNGVSQSVNIQTSMDGKAWGQPVVKAHDTVDYAMRYYTFPTVTAKYIRVAPTDHRQTTITELELYSSNTWSFENDAPNSIPRGFTDTRYATVADYLFPGWHSEKRMILVDMDPGSEATATLPTPDVPAQHTFFAYSGEGYGAGIVWDVNGKDPSGKQVTAYRFLLAPNFTTKKFDLSAWNGTSWKLISSGAIAQPANEVMFPVSIDTTTAQATLSVNGVPVSTTVQANPVAGFDGLTFTTNGDKAVNMEASFDAINVTALGAPGGVSD